MHPRNVDLETIKVNIYELRDPRDIECKPKYIGITKFKIEKRLADHISDATTSNKRTHKNNWIRSLVKEGTTPIIHLIEEVVGWDYACEVEKYWIKEFKEQGYNLTNGTFGGEGRANYEKFIPWNKGLKLPPRNPESIEKARKSAFKAITLLYDDGRIVEFESLEQCISYGIPRTSLWRGLRKGRNEKLKCNMYYSNINKPGSIHKFPKKSASPKNHYCKYSEETVMEIRRLASTKTITTNEIAKILNVPAGYVRKIRKKEIRK